MKSARMGRFTFSTRSVRRAVVSPRWVWTFTVNQTSERKTSGTKQVSCWPIQFVFQSNQAQYHTPPPAIRTMSDAAAAAEEEKTITLMANDGKEFQISEEAARVSQFCNDALGLDDDHEDEDEADNEHKEKIVDVPRVTGKCLGHVVRFMEHHCAKKMKDIELPMSGETFEEVIEDEWYQNFPKDMDSDVLFEIIAAANYMTITPLLNLACLWVTFDMQGKNIDQIREMLNAPELNDEELTRARQDHAWLFDEDEPAGQ